MYKNKLTWCSDNKFIHLWDTWEHVLLIFGLKLSGMELECQKPKYNPWLNLQFIVV